MTPCGAVRASSPSSTTVTTSNIWSWILLFYFFLRFGCGDSFCTDIMFLQTDDVTHRSLDIHRTVFTRRYSYTARFVHKKILYTDAFTQGSIYTQMLCTKMFLRAQIKAHRRSSHRTFSTEKFLHRTIFTHVFSTQKTFDTEKLVHTDCTLKFLQTDFFALRHFTQNNFYTAETFSHRCLYDPLRTKKLCTTVFTDRRFLHT